MKKTYLVKKNPDMPDSKDNWIMMNGFEFARFMETPEGQSRKDNFERLPSIGCEEDVIIAECGTERAKEWKSERNAHDYLLEQKIKSCIETLSFNALDSIEDEIIGEELMVDEDCEVVGEVTARIGKETLENALAVLSPDEYELIKMMFLSEKCLGEQEYADIKGVTHQAINKRKKRILKKIKNICDSRLQNQKKVSN